MDDGYTYGGSDWTKVTLYAPNGLEPPDEIEMIDREEGRRMLYVRLSDRTLICRKYQLPDKTWHGCGSYECHRGPVLGVCQCGSHTAEEARPQRADPGELPYMGEGMSNEQRKKALNRVLRP